MPLEHLPKITIGVAVLAAACFFLPWMSISSGEMTLINLSGFQLVTGSLRLNDPHINELRENYRYNEELALAVPASEQGHKRWYDAAPLLCVLALAGAGLSSLSNLNRDKAYVALVCSAAGFVIMGGIAVFDFGWRLPSEADASIQIGYESGVYVMQLCFVALAAINYLGMKKLEKVRVQAVAETKATRKYAPLDLDADFLDQPQQEPSADSFPMEINAPVKPQAPVPGRPEAPEQVKPPVIEPVKPLVIEPVPPQPQVLKCPACGTVVAASQPKCLKCGFTLVDIRK